MARKKEGKEKTTITNYLFNMKDPQKRKKKKKKRNDRRGCAFLDSRLCTGCRTRVRAGKKKRGKGKKKGERGNGIAAVCL